MVRGISEIAKPRANHGTPAKSHTLLRVLPAEGLTAAGRTAAAFPDAQRTAYADKEVIEAAARLYYKNHTPQPAHTAEKSPIGGSTDG